MHVASTAPPATELSWVLATRTVPLVLKMLFGVPVMNESRTVVVELLKLSMPQSWFELPPDPTAVTLTSVVDAARSLATPRACAPPVPVAVTVLNTGAPPWLTMPVFESAATACGHCPSAHRRRRNKA